MEAALLIGGAFGLSFGAVLLVLRQAGRLGLVQAPNERSSHLSPTPNGGGVGIVVAGSLAGAWLAWSQSPQLWAVIGPALALASVGLVDDIRSLSARLRFGVQVAVCAAMLALLGEMAPAELPGGLAMSGWPLSVILLLAGVWWVNLFNFMDGIDGLAGVQAVFMASCGAALAAWAHPEAMASPPWLMLLCLSAAAAGFLLLNWPPARIFMGDVGSTWLAFVIFGVALVTVRNGWLSYSAWLVLGAVFVTDATVTLLTRMARGERWYAAHRSHAYQKLSRMWQGERKIGHRSVTVLAAAIDVLWLAPLAWACTRWPQSSPLYLALAYLPLAAAVVWLGAGKGEAAGEAGCTG